MKTPETNISRQARRLSRGQIDRRRFVMSALASGVTLPTALSLASRAEAARPKPGGHLRYGLTRATAADVARQLTRCGLMRLDSAGRVRPDLAERLEPDTSGLQWQARLRAGISEQKVAAALLARDGSQWIDRITTAPGMLTLHLHAPTPGFDLHLARPAMALQLPEAALYRADPAAPDGRLQLLRNRDHWLSDIGHFDRIDLIEMTAQRLRQSAVMTGEVDVVNQVDPQALAMIASLPQLTVTESAGPRHLAVSPVQAAPEVSAALSFALDRTALLERGLLGHGSLGHDHPQRDLPAEAPRSRFDPDMARRLLRQAGGDRLTIDSGGWEGGAFWVDLINSTSRAAGLRLDAARPGTPADLRLHHVLQPGDPLQNAVIPLWCNDLILHVGALSAHPVRTRPTDVALHWWFS